MFCIVGVIPDRMVPLKYVVRMPEPAAKPPMSRVHTSSSSASLMNMFVSNDLSRDVSVR